MTEPIAEPEPVNPSHDPGVDPLPDEETADEDDAVDRAEKLDEPEASNIVPDALVGTDDLETTVGLDVL
jgi:hypothetical protein